MTERDDLEWLEPDGLGGFASGTASGRRTRRYHALLLTAATPPTGRVVLVNGFEAWVETPAGRFPISSQRYTPGVVHPDGESRIESFRHEPWPCWTYRLEDGTRVEQELFVPHGYSAVAVRWRLLGSVPQARLTVRPLMSGRDYHALHHENPGFPFDVAHGNGRVTWAAYRGLPEVRARSNGEYRHEPVWYRNFEYEQELERGLDGVEDQASPGTFAWELTTGDAVWLPAAEELGGGSAVDLFAALRDREVKRRAAFVSPLHRAADSYLVRRGDGKTILAGYPWFTDWGRDAFIALRGLCLATGRLDDTRDILIDWAGTASDGMLPNRFPDGGGEPEFNSVDASLWYVVAVHEYLHAAGRRCDPEVRGRLEAAVCEIVAGYASGTRFGIRADEDGLLRAGEPGTQLTWMDAKVGDWTVTPRVGKPVEVQALWLNALWVVSRLTPEWEQLLDAGLTAFRTRFWNDLAGCLFDVIDVNHVPGAVDPAVRPNQIFTVGGLPLPLLDGEQARRVVDAVESHLLTPLGLRSLAPGEPGYVGRYAGGVQERDGAYHQGTVWPWLLGPFVEAWVRVRGGTAAAKREARRRFLEPLRHHLDVAGMGHVSEIADADPPHAPRGCPFQAWSVGELLRLEHVVLAETTENTHPERKPARSAAV
ncbi:MAG: amylo-alpha-1,6-glucosidase [Gemmataceae bacterium]